MKRLSPFPLGLVLAIAAVLSVPLAAPAQAPKTIDLPKPQTTGGMPLMEALSARRTSREFGPEKLAPQMLSNLLWAAFGVNRTEIIGRGPNPGRTAPSGMNMQEIDLYAAFPDGVYLYEAIPHRLTLVTDKDVRAMTNGRPAAGTAPLCLIFVEDQDKRPTMPAGARPAGAPPAAAPPAAAKPAGAPPAAGPRATAGEVDCGFIGQNVYLFAASAGLNAWFYATDRDGLAKALNLRPGQKVLYGQAVGHPKKP
ncbi:MAG: nitroreductase family protein [Acidobacteriota bacterium]|nr:nitroreductase family protein [Acidobacteriota bacterium]